MQVKWLRSDPLSSRGLTSELWSVSRPRVILPLPPDVENTRPRDQGGSAHRRGSPPSLWLAAYAAQGPEGWPAG